MLVAADLLEMHWTYCMFRAFLFGGGVLMRLFFTLLYKKQSKEFKIKLNYMNIKLDRKK